MRLTKRRIENIEYDDDGPSSQVAWDDELANFGVRVYESGTKSFVVRYRNEHGRKRYMTLGKFGELTLQQARKLARDKFYEVRQGDDPAEERRRSRNAETLKDMGESYIEDYAKPRKKTWKKDQNRLERHIYPRWGTRSPADVTYADIDQLHRQLGRKEGKIYEANRTLEMVRKMFNWAAKVGYVGRDRENPAERIDPFKESSRERRMERDEAPGIIEGIEAESNPYMRGAFWLLLLTGARRTEVLSARWEHVDLEEREWTIPETKSERTHTLPLVQAAVDVLESLPRQKGNPHVFCGRKDGQHLVNIDKAWRRIKKRAEVDGLRVHDLRRTVASWLADLGHSEYIIKRVLNHSVPDITGVYARVGFDPIRDALEQYSERLLATLNDDGQILDFARAGAQSE